MTHEQRREAVRNVWPYAALAAALVMVAALAVYGFVSLDRRLDAALTALGQEQDATRQRGDKPVAPAPEDIADAPPPGPQGEPGRPGRDGRNGVDGRDGEPGRDGEDGRDGVDGEPGPPGPAGADGQQGPPGSDGQDGEPPASWTWTDPDGNTYTCTRDEGSPDNAPTYTCAREPRPGPIP